MGARARWPSPSCRSTRRSNRVAPLFRGRVRLDVGDYPGAIAELTAAMGAFPGLTDAYRLRAEAKARAGDSVGADEDRRSYHRLGGRDLPAYE